MKKVFTLFCFCWSLCFAAHPFYSFSNVKQRHKFLLLTRQLRCMVCQNENLADSNAKLAVELRQIIYHMIQQGKTVDEIKAYVVSRYGRFILFKPPFELNTYLLWLGPFGLLVLGGWILRRQINQ